MGRRGGAGAGGFFFDILLYSFTNVIIKTYISNFIVVYVICYIFTHS